MCLSFWKYQPGVVGHGAVVGAVGAVGVLNVDAGADGSGADFVGAYCVGADAVGVGVEAILGVVATVMVFVLSFWSYWFRWCCSCRRSSNEVR